MYPKTTTIQAAAKDSANFYIPPLTNTLYIHSDLSKIKVGDKRLLATQHLIM